MNKSFHYLILLFVLISCSNNSIKNNLKSKSVNYNKLNSFIQDSLPSILTLNQNFNQIFDPWQGLKTVESTSKILSSDSRTLTYFLESLKLELTKINDKQIPGKLNVPQVIGRFRVYKTEVLKINSNKIDLKNIQKFKENLKKIIISYNALISMMNKIAGESLESNENMETVEKK
ncbi:MAG: hypothetical protein CMC38_05400 [Flavobacteriaceae bacterium]|nr:hypothetical protein [Flavobacteriaceae bacterium]|tara:strand:+ start:169 stop:693 length:525 start_codon:yes stop_codon:yes gene_type:complete